MKLADLVDQFSRVQLATLNDNETILQFIGNIAMQTKQGGLGIDRYPDFFSLTQIQGEKSFTFLFLNQDDTLGGIGCISLTPMNIKGRDQWLGYCSDLKFSRTIDKETRLQFYQFFERLIRSFSSIEEFQGCQYIISSILDDNIAAKKSFVAAKSKKSGIDHRPVYQYENVNVLARLPILEFPYPNPIKVLRGHQVGKEKILRFLTSNPESAEIVWTRNEIERRHLATGFSFDDFYIHADSHDEILGCALLLSDSQHRKMRVSPMPLSLKISQYLTPLFGQPAIKENDALNIGYFSFLKIQNNNPKLRSQTIDAFLQQTFRDQKSRIRNQRFHVINVQEPMGYGLKSQLVKKGYLCNSFGSTVYQVTAEDEPQNFLQAKQSRMDFDVVFH